MSHSESPGAELATSSTANSAPKTRQLLKSVLAILAAVAISVAIVFLSRQIENFAIYGYPAVFLISLVGNATIVLPAPSMAVVLGVGSALNPVAVGIIAGLGSALGELTGFLAGTGGRIVIENQELYNRIEGWMRKKGMLVIFVLGLIPNPAFDVGGMIAGALKMPVWKFLLAAWAGKGLRLVVFAMSGQFFLTRFLYWWIPG